MPSSRYPGDYPDPLRSALHQGVHIEPQLLEFPFPGRWFADANRRGSPSVPGLCLALQPTGCAFPRITLGPELFRQSLIAPIQPSTSDGGERLTTRVLRQGVRTPVTGRRCRACVPEARLCQSFSQLLLPTNDSYLARFTPLPNGAGLLEWRVAWANWPFGLLYIYPSLTNPCAFTPIMGTTDKVSPYTATLGCDNQSPFGLLPCTEWACPWPRHVWSRRVRTRPLTFIGSIRLSFLGIVYPTQ